MHSETRQRRAAAVMETLERNWSPRSQTDPLAALWIATTATAATDMAASEHKPPCCCQP